MAVTLEWVRDNYDENKNRYIDDAEASMASYRLSIGGITREEHDAVIDAWSNHTLLPEYVTTHVTSFNIPIGSTLKADGVEVI